jgi:hypothetical protein
MVAEQNPSLVDLVDTSQEAVANYQIRVRSLTAADFRHAFAQIKPETRSEDLARFGAWQRTHAA